MTVYDLKPGVAIRIVKTFRDYYGGEFTAGTVLHFVERNYVPYHSGHTVTFREAIMYLCDDDQTAAIVQNHSDEFYVAA